MKKVVLILVFLVLLATGFATWHFSFKGEAWRQEAAAAGAAAAQAQEPYVVPPLENEYRNDEFRFALSVPEGFSVGELPSQTGEGKTILLQDARGNGIQILITPFPDDLRVLDAARVHADIPDMQISDVQPVEIGDPSINSGQAYYRGIAFLSDNEAFGGASREVWFVFHGNLYQISTYARLDLLLKEMFATWKFF